MWRTKPPRMPKIRPRLESYVVRNTADIVDDLSDERREELAEVLHDLEGHSPRADGGRARHGGAGREARAPQHRDREVTGSDRGARGASSPRREPRAATARSASPSRSSRAHPRRGAGAGVPQRARGPARPRSSAGWRPSTPGARAASRKTSELSNRERTLSLREAGIENRTRELMTRPASWKAAPTSA